MKHARLHSDLLWTFKTEPLRALGSLKRKHLVTACEVQNMDKTEVEVLAYLTKSVIQQLYNATVKEFCL